MTLCHSGVRFKDWDQGAPVCPDGACKWLNDKDRRGLCVLLSHKSRETSVPWRMRKHKLILNKLKVEINIQLFLNTRLFVLGIFGLKETKLFRI